MFIASAPGQTVLSKTCTAIILLSLFFPLSETNTQKPQLYFCWFLLMQFSFFTWLFLKHLTCIPFGSIMAQNTHKQADLPKENVQICWKVHQQKHQHQKQQQQQQQHGQKLNVSVNRIHFFDEFLNRCW